MVANYSEENIKTLNWYEHIRLRPGMYIGKKGDGASSDDGIYILIKEVIDNSIDEFTMGYGKRIDIKIEEQKIIIRDYGRGIPLGKVIDVSSKMNTGAKYDSKAFKKSVGLNGVGIKAVNALSSEFEIRSFRDGETSGVIYSRGKIVKELPKEPTTEQNGVYVSFIPDNDIFVNYKYRTEYIETLISNYTYLNSGLSIYYNNTRFYSKNGLLDLLYSKISSKQLYDIIH